MSVAQASSPGRGDMGRQIQLPFKKAFDIAWNSIRIRFWRSMITAAGIFLGIAFFTSVRMSAEFAGIQHDIVQSKIAARQRGDVLTPAEQQLIERSVTSKAEERAGAARLVWLSIMGLLVCTIGITNAMLMSVTERYKEIGTMKCLGALDSLIVKLFFIEACLLGIIASAIGFLLGWVVISVVHIFVDGSQAFGATFWAATGRVALASILIGSVLTFVATIAPAIRAAKMPAAAALRVEI